MRESGCSVNNLLNVIFYIFAFLFIFIIIKIENIDKKNGLFSRVNFILSGCAFAIFGILYYIVIKNFFKVNKSACETRKK